MCSRAPRTHSQASVNASYFFSHSPAHRRAFLLSQTFRLRFLAAVSSHSCSSRRMNEYFATLLCRARGHERVRSFVRSQPLAATTTAAAAAAVKPRRMDRAKSSSSERCRGMSQLDEDGQTEKRVGGEERRERARAAAAAG